MKYLITPQDISEIDRDYFRRIEVTCYYVLLQSRCTGHYWYIRVNCTSNHRTNLFVYHKHHKQDAFHPQTTAPSIKKVCKYIKEHDAYHLKRVKAKRVKTNRNKEI